MSRVRYPASHRSGDGKRFDFFEENMSVWELAAQQGVSPVRNLDELRGEFWPKSEDTDDFVAAVRQWRHEGG